MNILEQQTGEYVDRVLTPEQKERLFSWIDTAGLEFMPDDLFLGNPTFLQQKNRIISITTSDTHPLAKTVDFSTKLADAGFIVEPHLRSCDLNSQDKIAQCCTTLKKAGVTHIFTVGGDRPKSDHYFSTMDMLITMELEGFVFPFIRVGTYPQEHEFLTKEQLVEARRQKYQFGKEHGIEISAITQMCLTADPIIALAKERDEKENMPIIVGVNPASNIATLANIAKRTHITDLISYAKKVKDAGSLIIQSMKGYSPDALIMDLSQTNLFSGIQIFAYTTPPERIQQWMDDFRHDIERIPTSQ